MTHTHTNGKLIRLRKNEFGRATPARSLNKIIIIRASHPRGHNKKKRIRTFFLKKALLNLCGAQYDDELGFKCLFIGETREVLLSFFCQTFDMPQSCLFFCQTLEVLQSCGVPVRGRVAAQHSDPLSLASVRRVYAREELSFKRNASRKHSHLHLMRDTCVGH